MRETAEEVGIEFGVAELWRMSWRFRRRLVEERLEQDVCVVNLVRKIGIETFAKLSHVSFSATREESAQHPSPASPAREEPRPPAADEAAGQASAQAQEVIRRPARAGDEDHRQNHRHAQTHRTPE